MTRLSVGRYPVVLSALCALLALLACGGGGGGSDGETSTAQEFAVNAAGGTIQFVSPDDPDIIASLVIPAGAVSDGTVITVDLDSSVSDSNVLPGLGFDFSPDGLAFAQSVDMVVHYNQSALPPGVDESELAIHKWTGSGWQELSGVVNTVADTVTATISGFSRFFVFPEIPSPPVTGTWTHPASVSDHIAFPVSDTGGGPMQLYAAMADNGEAVVSWLSGISAGEAVFFTEYRDGSWTHASAPISADDYVSLMPTAGWSSQVFDLALDVNEAGETIMAYNQLHPADTKAWRVYTSLYAGTWTHATDYEADAHSVIGPNASRPSAYYPAAAMDGNGDAIVVWHMKDVAGNDGYYRREYRDGAWSPVPVPGVDTLPNLGTPRWAPPLVAANEAGDAVLLWEETVGATPTLVALEYRDAGGGHAWSGTPVALGVVPGHSNDGKVAMADNGDIVVLARSSFDLYVVEKRSGGDWTEPRYLNEEGDAVESGAIDLAVDAAGNTIVVWQQPDGSGTDHIYMREYSAAAGTWTATPALALDAISPPAVSSTYMEYFGNPSVAMSDDGDAVIVFTGSHSLGGVCDGVPAYTGFCQQIFLTQRTAWGQWTHETGTAEIISPTINLADRGVNREPVAAMDGNGDAIVVWDQNDDLGTRHLFMSEYR